MTKSNALLLKLHCISQESCFTFPVLESVILPIVLTPIQQFVFGHTFQNHCCWFPKSKSQAVNSSNPRFSSLSTSQTTMQTFEIFSEIHSADYIWQKTIAIFLEIHSGTSQPTMAEVSKTTGSLCFWHHNQVWVMMTWGPSGWFVTLKCLT